MLYPDWTNPPEETVSTYDGQPQGGQAFPPPPSYGVPPQSQPPNVFGDAPPPPPSPGGVAPPAPAAPSGGQKKASGLVGIVVLVLIAGAVFGINWFTSRNDISKAGVGACATFDESADEPYKKADCSDAAATFVVLKIVNGDEECKDVAGAERSITKEGGGEICFGVKGVDPATSINVAQVGDCLTIVGNDAVRTACSSSDATHKVLKRLTDVSKLALKDPCEDVADYTSSYSWTWTTQGGTVNIPSMRNDVVLCLGDL
jgi:hypothetical protein